MLTVISSVALLGLLANVGLLALLLAHRRHLRVPLVWNVLPVALAAMLLVPLALPPGLLPEGLALGLAITATTIGYLAAFGVVALRDTTAYKGRWWLVLTLVWLLALVIAILASEPALDGPGWWHNLLVSRSPAPGITVGGFLLVGLLLLVTLARAYVHAPLPELANRVLYWVCLSAATLMSGLFLLSGSRLLILTGVLLLILVSVGSVYAQTARRLIDLHAQIGGIARSLALLVFGALVIWTAMDLAWHVNPDASNADLFLLVLAIAAAILYGLAEIGVRLLVQKVALTHENDLADAAQRYSRALTSTDDLRTLAAQVSRILQQELHAETASLRILTPVAEGSLYEIDSVDQDPPQPPGTLRADSPIYQRLAVEQTPFTSYELAFGSDFQTLDDDQRAQFEQAGMNAYAPILSGNQLIGLLAVGAKTGDVPYSVQDLRLLSTLAHQTAPALRHALMLGALDDARQTAETLRRRLDITQRQIETLDSVKADFIAIASHELRTPLAQLKGNVDLMDALNQTGALDETQIADIVGILRAAGERLESVIDAMLDASQIETGTLDLNLAPVQLEDVVRQAVEPLTGGIRQRRIGIAITGLRDLPILQADGPRLMLAFRNVLLNAIKYTPDNGKIEVMAQREAATRLGQRDTLLISVKDSGVGIQAANLELIFYKFFRAHDPGTHSSGEVKFMGAGPGLGLPITRGIVEAHGGQIWAESEGYDPTTCPGTTILIRLPLAPLSDNKTRTQPAAAVRLNDQAVSGL